MDQISLKGLTNKQKQKIIEQVNLFIIENNNKVISRLVRKAEALYKNMIAKIS